MMEHRIRWRGIVESRDEAARRVPEKDDVVLVRRGGVDRWLVFRCPTGCGKEISINLDPRLGPAWRIYRRGPDLTVYPSVWLESGCEAHFIVSRGHLWLAGDDWLDYSPPASEALLTTVAGALGHEPIPYSDLAERLAEDPWDVLRACRVLVRRGMARESDELVGAFSHGRG